MPTRRVRGTDRRGMSLLEIMIVVTIIAILAGIVFPHFAKSSQESRASALLTDLHQARQALQRYHLEHGHFPLLADMWDVLTTTTDVNGNPGTEFGPYLKKPPVNPFTRGSVCAADNSADWLYDETTGSIFGIAPNAAIVELDLPPSDVVPSP